jgi:hypothetical protein
MNTKTPRNQRSMGLESPCAPRASRSSVRDNTRAQIVETGIVKLANSQNRGTQSTEVKAKRLSC